MTFEVRLECFYFFLIPTQPSSLVPSSHFSLPHEYYGKEEGRFGFVFGHPILMEEGTEKQA